MTLTQIEADIESGEMGEFGRTGAGSDSPTRTMFGVMHQQILSTAWRGKETKKRAKELAERAAVLAYK